MTIGIDVSALQSAHRMRGIGATVLNFINNISEADKQNNKFVLFMFEDGSEETLSLINLEGMDYEVRYMQSKGEVTLPKQQFLSARVSRLLTSTIRQLGELKDRYFGNSSFQDTGGLDVFIQPDQSASLPRSHHGMKKALIIYDIIPYVLEWEYLWSYSTARLKGFSRKAALRCQARRVLYIKKLKVNARRANELLAISEATKQDFVNHVGVRATKIKVVPLGISPPEGEGHKSGLLRYHKTSWGYLPKSYALDPEIPYIFYVGGADKRRRIDELVTAFNRLRASGVELKLILCGDTMQGPDNIATEEIQGALKTSSYLDDIIFTGFIPNDVRDYLYKNTLAFVYPSKYEGFGLPVLEAMMHGSPVICYPCGAVKEVAENLPIYTNDAEGLAKEIKNLLKLSAKDRETIAQKNIKHASKYSWAKTSANIIAAVS